MAKGKRRANGFGYFGDNKNLVGTVMINPTVRRMF